ncbi:MAG: hypothetical protein KGL39_45050 [Patescibacteria group bacterium]|nr:hypothetical protein [Patescibacteria group bacterium]
MKLTELEPRWVGLHLWSSDDKFYIGVSFMSPLKTGQRIAVLFEPPIDPSGLAARYGWPSRMIPDVQHWQRPSGETFETLTLTPSIDFSKTKEWLHHQRQCHLTTKPAMRSIRCADWFNPMKHNIQFNPEDFKGSGQLVIRNSSTRGSKDYGFAVTVAYKVGYLPGREKQSVLLVALSDGMATRFDSKQQLCDFLNADSEGFRPMSTSEIRNVLAFQGARFDELNDQALR